MVSGSLATTQQDDRPAHRAPLDCTSQDACYIWCMPGMATGRQQDGMKANQPYPMIGLDVCHQSQYIRQRNMQERAFLPGPIV